MTKKIHWSHRSNIVEIRETIAHYRPDKEIKRTLLEMGRLGFEFSGHGTSLVDFEKAKFEEDFSLSRDIHFAGNVIGNIHVNITSKRRATMSVQIGPGKAYAKEMHSYLLQYAVVHILDSFANMNKLCSELVN